MEAIATRRALVLRYALRLAALNALALGWVAVATAGPGVETLKAALAGLVALGASLVALVRAPTFAARHGSDARRLVLGLAIVGDAVLIGDASSASALFAAVLTPVGVAALLDDWVAAAAATGLLSLGLALAVAQSEGPAIAEAFSDALPALAIVAGGILPIRYALLTIKRSPQILAETGGAAIAAAPSRPTNTESRANNERSLREMIAHGLTVEEIAAVHPRRRDKIQSTFEAAAVEREVAARIRLGRTYKEIANELSMTANQVEHITKSKLQPLYGADSKSELRAKLRDLPLRSPRKPE
jgi:hypothetical protein